MVGRGQGFVGSLAGVLAGLAVALACASDPLLCANGRLVHRKYGFSFAAPEAGASPWRRIEVDRALAAWERPAGARLTVQSECGRKPARPQLQAYGLLIGVEQKRLLQSGPVAVGPWPGWSQRVDVGDQARPLHMKTVTIVAQSCTVDFLLLAGDDFESAEAIFDRWWQSFEMPDRPPEVAS
jgi:hypothetical protein